MTTDSVPAGGDPRRLLADSRHLARRVRLAQRVTWFPLLVLAAVTFVAIPVARYGPWVLDCEPLREPAGATICAGYRPVLMVYWPVALLLAYAAIAYCYVRVARARGLGGRVAPYVIAGIALTALATVAALWGIHQAQSAVHHQPPADLYGPNWAYRLVGTGGAIGLALLVLAWLERHLALLLFSLAYLAVVLVPINFGWGTHWGPAWGFAPPLVINGGVLLLGGLGFVLAQRLRWYR